MIGRAWRTVIRRRGSRCSCAGRRRLNIWAGKRIGAGHDPLPRSAEVMNSRSPNTRVIAWCRVNGLYVDGRLARLSPHQQRRDGILEKRQALSRLLCFRGWGGRRERGRLAAQSRAGWPAGRCRGGLVQFCRGNKRRRPRLLGCEQKRFAGKTCIYRGRWWLRSGQAVLGRFTCCRRRRFGVGPQCHGGGRQSRRRLWRVRGS